MNTILLGRKKRTSITNGAAQPETFTQTTKTLCTHARCIAGSYLRPVIGQPDAA